MRGGLLAGGIRTGRGLSMSESSGGSGGGTPPERPSWTDRRMVHDLTEPTDRPPAQPPDPASADPAQPPPPPPPGLLRRQPAPPAGPMWGAGAAAPPGGNPPAPPPPAGRPSAAGPAGPMWGAGAATTRRPAAGTPPPPTSLAARWPLRCRLPQAFRRLLHRPDVGGRCGRAASRQARRDPGCLKVAIILVVVLAIALVAFVALAGVVLNRIVGDLGGPDGGGIDDELRVPLRRRRADAVRRQRRRDRAVGTVGRDDRIHHRQARPRKRPGLLGHRWRQGLHRPCRPLRGRRRGVRLRRGEDRPPSRRREDQGGGVTVETEGYYGGEVHRPRRRGVLHGHLAGASWPASSSARATASCTCRSVRPTRISRPRWADVRAAW